MAVRLSLKTAGVFTNPRTVTVSLVYTEDNLIRVGGKRYPIRRTWSNGRK